MVNFGNQRKYVPLPLACERCRGADAQGVGPMLRSTLRAAFTHLSAIVVILSTVGSLLISYQAGRTSERAEATQAEAVDLEKDRELQRHFDRIAVWTREESYDTYPPPDHVPAVHVHNASPAVARNPHLRGDIYFDYTTLANAGVWAFPNGVETYIPFEIQLPDIPPCTAVVYQPPAEISQPGRPDILASLEYSDRLVYLVRDVAFEVAGQTWHASLQQFESNFGGAKLYYDANKYASEKSLSGCR